MSYRISPEANNLTLHTIIRGTVSKPSPHTWTAPLWAMATNGRPQQQQQQQHTRAQQQIPESVVPPPHKVYLSNLHSATSLPPSRKSTSSTKMTALQAAASDRLIAREVWTRAKDDEVRDALGRMLGWVEELVSIPEKNEFHSRPGYPLTCLLVSISLTFCPFSFRVTVPDPPTAQILPSAK
jgi:hypothetical protein